jgi:hypothetical protein
MGVCYNTCIVVKEGFEMTATVYSVYSRNAVPYVVAVTSSGKTQKFFNTSEFDVANVMRMYEDKVLTMSVSESLFKKTPTGKALHTETKVAAKVAKKPAGESYTEAEYRKGCEATHEERMHKPAGMDWGTYYKTL